MRSRKHYSKFKTVSLQNSFILLISVFSDVIFNASKTSFNLVCVWSQQMDDVDDDDEGARPLAESLLLAIADLLFCPDFTVQSHKRGGPVSERLC